MLSYNKLISQKPVLQAKYFVVKEDKIELPNGEVHTHHNIYRSPASIVFPITDSFEIYLIKQYRYLFGKYIYEAVAGYLEKGETPLENAKKELEEEAGLVANSWKELLKTEMSASIFKGEQYLFLAQELKIVEPKREAAEQIEVKRMPLNNAIELVYKGEIVTTTTIVGLLLLDKMRRDRKI